MCNVVWVTHKGSISNTRALRLEELFPSHTLVFHCSRKNLIFLFPIYFRFGVEHERLYSFYDMCNKNRKYEYIIALLYCMSEWHNQNYILPRVPMVKQYRVIPNEGFMAWFLFTIKDSELQLVNRDTLMTFLILFSHQSSVKWDCTLCYYFRM